ncbi:MAG: hypothetical protein ACJA2C_002836 [Marinoscillum sp.]|jgi:hypothetical protein
MPFAANMKMLKGIVAKAILGSIEKSVSIHPAFE